MRKKSAITPLPPLSLDALRDVETIEEFAQRALKRSDSSSRFNFAKALEALRTCVVSVFDTKTAYYRSLANFREEWITDIGAATISSALGLIPDMVRDEDIREMEGKLCDTLNEHLKAETSAQPKQTLPDIEPISKQLENLRIESRLTVEQLAEGVDLALRSVYRHLSEDSAPSRRNIGAYERFFSARLSKTVHLKTPPIVSKKSAKRH